MTVTLDLSAEAQARLQAEATRRGITLDQLIAEIADSFPAETTTPRSKRAFVGIGIGAGTEVEFERRKDTIIVRKSDLRPTRGRQLAERLKGRGDIAMTTDEIMALTRGT